MITFSAAFIVWAVAHSALADYRLKQRFRARFGDGWYRWYRLAYNFFAMISLAPLGWFYRELPGTVLWRAPGPGRWLLIGLQGIGLLGVGAAVLQTHAAEFIGLAQLGRGYVPDQHATLRVSGLYRYVRHPIYTFSLLLVWAMPVLSVDRLLLALLATLYFYLGARHEEQSLRAEFGLAYEAYREHVPMLLPRLW